MAPLFNLDEGRKVILPKGKWYDFYTGRYAGNGEIIEVENGFESIPLFVKDGGIIPMMPAVRQTSEWKEKTPLELRVYGTADGEFVLYDDDGKTFNFEQGKYTTKLLKVSDQKGQIQDVHSSEHWNYGEISWKFMTN